MASHALAHVEPTLRRRYAHLARDVRRFVRTPKGLTTVALVVLASVAGRVEGIARVAPGLGIAVTTAMVLDAVLLRIRRRRWVFPSGALLTGLLIGMVISPVDGPHVFAMASATAIVAKHLVRTRSVHVFNPAALGLVVVYYMFDSAQNWWGAMPAIVPSAALALILAVGAVIAMRVNKVPLVLAFFGAHVVLFTAAAMLGDPDAVAEVFVPPDLLAALFCAFFMLTDPPTSPTRLAPQIVCGVLVASASFGVFHLLGAAHYLLSGVLAGNAFEAWRRRRMVVR